MCVACVFVLFYPNLQIIIPNIMQEKKKNINKKLSIHRKNIHQIRNKKNKLTPAIGAYCRINASRFILLAWRMYFLDSERRLDERSCMRSSESPRYIKSSMFLVITLVTS